MRIAFTALTAAAALAFAPTPASAQTQDAPTAPERLQSGDVEGGKARANGAIDRRLVTIERLETRVSDHPHVTDPHQRELLDELGRASAGLRALSADIAQATTIEELRDLVPKIATDFRVYLVVAPKVHQVLGSDSVVAAGTRLEKMSESLAGRIDRAVENGVDASEAAAHLADMTAEFGQALAVGEPDAGTVLPLTAADWPDPAAAVLAQGRADLGDARRFLREARISFSEAVAPLREALGS